MNQSKSRSIKNVATTNGINSQALLDNLATIVDSSEFRMKVSLRYLVFTTDSLTIKIKHIENKKELLVSNITFNNQEKVVYVNKQELLDYFVNQAKFDQKQWSIWKRFDAIGIVETSTSYKASSKSLAELFRLKIDGAFQHTSSSIDVIVSQNDNKSIYLIFNEGLDTCPVRSYFIDGFLSDMVIVHSCILADIKEIVFWDGITSTNKRIRVDEMLYLLRA